MKEIPLIFTGPMVRAILEDRKTQTRRLTGRLLQPGDLIWLRETHMIGMQRTTDAPSRQCPTDSALWAYYAASNHPPAMARLSSTHMPRWASRALLEVTAPSRLEHLQDITEEDAQAEGLPWSNDFKGWCGRPDSNAYFGQARLAFKSWWIHLHGAKSWSSNPLIYVHTFKRVTP